MNTPKRVLLVDDDSDVIRGASLWLRAAGYETIAASDGHEALATAASQCPDAIVLDVRMPVMDGLQALAELKRRDDTRRIPIVMLSASLIDQQQALDGGARFFLSKPYVGKELVSAVSAAIASPDPRTEIAQTDASQLSRSVEPCRAHAIPILP